VFLSIVSPYKTGFSYEILELVASIRKAILTAVQNDCQIMTRHDEGLGGSVKLPAVASRSISRYGTAEASFGNNQDTTVRQPVRDEPDLHTPTPDRRTFRKNPLDVAGFSQSLISSKAFSHPKR
jgi:hypothetical protein